VKMAPLSLQLRKHLHEIVVHTGQHYDYLMSKVFFEDLGVPQPDYDLGVGSASHGEQTGRMLMGVEQVLLRERPSLVIVYGDTIRPWLEPSLRPSCISQWLMSRPGCVVTTGRCLRKSTEFLRIISPPYCSAPPPGLYQTWPRKGSLQACTRWGT